MQSKHIIWLQQPEQEYMQSSKQVRFQSELLSSLARHAEESNASYKERRNICISDMSSGVQAYQEGHTILYKRMLKSMSLNLLSAYNQIGGQAIQKAEMWLKQYKLSTMAGTWIGKWDNVHQGMLPSYK